MDLKPVTFEIRVRPTKDGFSLHSGEILSQPLWFTNVAQAVSYAKDRGSRHRSTIKVFNAAGEAGKRSDLRAKQFKLVM